MLIRGAPQVAQVQMVGDNPSKPLAPPDEPGPGRGQAGSVSQERSKALGTGATQADSRQERRLRRLQCRGAAFPPHRHA